jgi:triacylglycerol lipase
MALPKSALAVILTMFVSAAHRHMSEVYSINAADTRLTDQIPDFVNTGK